MFTVKNLEQKELLQDKNFKGFKSDRLNQNFSQDTFYYLYVVAILRQFTIANIDVQSFYRKI